MAFNNKQNEILKQQQLDNIKLEFDNIQLLQNFASGSLLYVRRELEYFVFKYLWFLIKDTYALIHKINDQIKTQNTQNQQEEQNIMQSQLQQSQNLQQQQQQKDNSDNITKKYESIQKKLNMLIKDMASSFLDEKIRKYLLYMESHLFDLNIASDQYLLMVFNDQQKVELSHFAYEYLLAFIVRNQLNLCFQFQSQFVIKSMNKYQPLTEKNQLFNQDQQSQLSVQKKGSNNNNEQQYNIQILTPTEDLEIWRRLDLAQQKQNQQGNQINIAKEKLVFEAAFSYSESHKQQQENSQAIKQKNKIPQIKLKDRINLSQNFLDRKLVDQDNHPQIIQVKVDDSADNISCIAIQKDKCNIILCGTTDSQILLFVINKQYRNGYEKKFQQMKSQQGQGDFSGDLEIQEKKGDMSDGMEEEDNQQGEENYDEENCKIRYSHKFRGHEGPITSINLLYDEQYFLSSSTDLTIRLWCIRQKACLQIYKAHLKTIWEVAFAPMGYFFASCSADNTAILWTTDRIACIRIYSGHIKDVQHVEFNQGFTHLITSSLDFTIRIWDIKKSICMKVIFFESPVTCFKLSYSGYYLVLGTEQGEVKLYNIKDECMMNGVYYQQQSQQYNQNDKSNGQQQGQNTSKSQLPIYSVDISMDEDLIISNTNKTLVYYQTNQFLEQQGKDIYQDRYNINNYEQKDKAEIIFHPFEPQEAFQIRDGKQRFMLSVIHPKNFIIVVSK